MSHCLPRPGTQLSITQHLSTYHVGAVGFKWPPPGTLVGPQVSTNQDILTNTTEDEVADSFACTLNWINQNCMRGFAQPSNSFAGFQRGVQSTSAKCVNGPMLGRTNNCRGHGIRFGRFVFYLMPKKSFWKFTVWIPANEDPCTTKLKASF